MRPFRDLQQTPNLFIAACCSWLLPVLVVLFVSLQPLPALSAAAASSPRLSEPTGQGMSLEQLAAKNGAIAAELETLEEEATAKGRVRVAVKTAVAFAPETLLDPASAAAQRRDIAAAAEALRAAMPDALSFEALPDKPYVVLELNAAGFAKLVTIPNLARITAADALNWKRDYVQIRSQATAAAEPSTGTAPLVRPRIVGGNQADPTTHPFQVGLLEKQIADNLDAIFCGGTLVAPRFVVTAAHCADYFNRVAADVEVLVETQQLNGTGRRVAVQRVHVHPRWKASTFDYDVAVLELAEPVTGIAVATLARTQPTTAGTLLRTSGWGTRTVGVRDVPQDLQQVDVPFVPTARKRCQSKRGITSRMICAGTAGKDSCQGDSGGPLTIDRGSGYTELVGIVSNGYGCALAGYPGVYSNVAESSINSFIRNIALAPVRTIAFAAATQSVSEGARRVTLTLGRSTTEGTARVSYATADGTAVKKADYRARTSTVSFKRGQATASFTITLTNDKVKESDETFVVTLSNPGTGWTLGTTTTTTVTITDND